MSTPSAKYRFVMRENGADASDARATPLSLVLESVDGGPAVLDGGVMVFHLAVGTSMEWAEETAKALSQHVTDVSFTR